MRIRFIVGALALASFAAPAASQQPLIARLGTCALESGATLDPCFLAYDTLGTRAPDGSNVVLMPVWYGGTVASNRPFVGPGRMIDTDRWFVVLAGAFGDGQSSSPSNAWTGDPLAFPRYGIRDMVRAQHRLLTEVLGVERLHAVVGMSMGGFQALEWAITYPDFVARALPIVASPRFGSFETAFFSIELGLVEECARVGCEGLGRTIWALEYLLSSTPEHWLDALHVDSVPAFLASVEAEAAGVYDAADNASQLRAILAHDVAAPYGGSLEMAAARVEAELMLAIGPRDHLVTPANARAFARIGGFELVEVGDTCGHAVWSCALPRLSEVVSDFLARPDGGPGSLDRTSRPR